MRRAVILVNAYTRSASELNQSVRLKEELEKRDVRTNIFRNDFAPAYLREGEIVRSLRGYDFCVFYDKDKYIPRLLEKSGMRLFNRAAAIEVCDDKFSTYLALAGKIPMPTTIPAPLCYTPGERVKKDFLDFVQRELGYPLVVKECYGSLGNGVFRADNRKELEEVAEKLQKTPHLFQKMIAESVGRDLRVIVIGGRVTAAMLRHSECDFRSNAELGGKGEPFSPDGKTCETAIRIAGLLGLDYCGIDFLFGERGMMLCEVNSNAFFGVAERVTGVNIAREYAAHICREIYGEE